LCIKIWNLFDIVINKSEALPGGSLTVLLFRLLTNQTFKTIYLEIISLFDVKMGPQYFYKPSVVFTLNVWPLPENRASPLKLKALVSPFFFIEGYFEAAFNNTSESGKWKVLVCAI
jgi:hypothetical protein